jgi:tripartite-type tricarboxylate transporter receptor subunit TctC
MTGPRHSAVLPEVPTATEFGLSGLPAGGWYGVMAPADTPPAVIARIHDDLATVLARSEIRERMKAQGIEPPAPISTSQFADFIHGEAAYWESATKRLGMYRQE